MTEQHELQVTTDLWLKIESEINHILPKMENETLTPDDVKEIKGLVSLVEKSSKAYNKHLTTLMRSYKQELQQKLADLGYTRISEYITTKRKEQQDTVNARIANKNEVFTNLVNKALKEAPHVSASVLAPHIISFTHHLFPKLSSGAITNNISDEDWIKMYSVIHSLITSINNVMTPPMTMLPIESNTMRLFVDVLRTADIKILQGLDEATHNDRRYYTEMVLRTTLNTEEDVLSHITTVINSQSDEKIDQIQFILNIWKSKQ